MAGASAVSSSGGPVPQAERGYVWGRANELTALTGQVPLPIIHSHGDIAQLGERGVRIAEVGGSNPPISTNSEAKSRGLEAGRPTVASSPQLCVLIPRVPL